MIAQNKIRQWMRNELREDARYYQDSAGEWNCTLLAENCADALDLYDLSESGEENYHIPDEVFDEAVNVTETFEKNND
jgi:hypothetical protein